MNDYALQNLKKGKDLGILIDDKLKFHTHTSSVIKKANSILGLIKRSFSSMVRPHLEYGNVIWGDHYKGDIKAIEKVQKRATKKSEFEEFTLCQKNRNPKLTIFSVPKKKR